MPDDRKPDRLYTEEEVRAVMSRAIERQEADRRRQASPESGLTIEEIHRIAAEVGVDPRYVTSAAAELERAAPEAKPGWFGGPMKVELERTVPGALTPESMAAIVEEIRRTFRNDRGYVETLGSTLEWRSGMRSGEDIHFNVRAEDDRLTLQLGQSFEGWAVLWYLMPLFPSIFAVLLFLAAKDVVAGSIATVLTVAFMLAARTGFTRSVRKRKKTLQGLMDRAEAAVLRTGPVPAEAGRTPTAPAVALPEVEAPAEEPPARTSQATRLRP